jgi:hypothetical protein
MKIHAPQTLGNRCSANISNLVGLQQQFVKGGVVPVVVHMR